MNDFDDIQHTGTHADDHHIELASLPPAALQRLIARHIGTENAVLIKGIEAIVDSQARRRGVDE